MEKLNPEAVRTAVLDCIASVAPEADFDALRADKPWRDQLEIDSFDFQNILAAIEARLGVSVPENDYRKLSGTLEALLDYIIGAIRKR